MPNKQGLLTQIGFQINLHGTFSDTDERGKRPDVTVHIPVFDQEHFGHPVDDRISNAVSLAGKILEQAGVQKSRWHD